jgi:hypothetical protein
MIHHNPNSTYRLDNVQAQPAKALLIDGRTASTKRLSNGFELVAAYIRGQDTARGELKWQNIDADDLPAEVKKSFDDRAAARRARLTCASESVSRPPMSPTWRVTKSL